MNIIREMKGDFMWCYRNNRKRFISEIVGFLFVMGGCMFLAIVCSQVWGQ